LIFGRVLDILAAQLVLVRGDSMTPLFRGGAWVLVARRAYRRGSPGRFDVVRLEDPSRPGHWTIKRVVALPCEQVQLDSDRLTVDGEEVAEPYLRGRPHAGPGQQLEWQLGRNEYIVLGDNRLASRDSRNYGPVRLDAFRGRAMWRPWKRIS